MRAIGGAPRRRAASDHPNVRRLRVFAFDPSLATRLDTVLINRLVLSIPWEPLTDRGPCGEYLEVIDRDPPSQCFYAPVNLNDPHLLARDGLEPSETNPQFHQQMVYAVAMTTIDHFERALGRVALWAPRTTTGDDGEERDAFVKQLRIYPHALREANAYYSPKKKALLFGYFAAPEGNADIAPNSTIFTCLSHDIIAHETTHALLDGMHRRFREATNPDILALHEAFADIVALFQRFSHAEILEHQIARTRGDLEQQNLLGQLAQQFGIALGRRSALRDALGDVDPVTGEWRPRQPDATLLQRTTGAHSRGAVLVAAVFDAFLGIYKRRIADLLRIASGGQGSMPAGELHPDLVKRLAAEAADTAEQVLQMCIRGLDYCPPVDVTFGDYLRAIITADHDLSSDDPLHYRIAFIESFRRWGIYPETLRSLSVDALRWPRLSELAEDRDEAMPLPAVAAAPRRKKRAYKRQINYAQQMAMQEDLNRMFAPQELSGTQTDGQGGLQHLSVGWDLYTDRERAWRVMRDNADRFHAWLTTGSGREHAEVFGLVLGDDAPPSVMCDADGRAAVEVHSVRTALRVGPRGATSTELVVEITQSRCGFYDRDRQKAIDESAEKLSAGERGDFVFRRGCTLLIDPGDESIEVRYVIKTRGDISSDEELDRVRRYRTREAPLAINAFAAHPGRRSPGDEGFAHLHRFG